MGELGGERSQRIISGVSEVHSSNADLDLTVLEKEWIEECSTQERWNLWDMWEEGSTYGQWQSLSNTHPKAIHLSFTLYVAGIP